MIIFDCDGVLVDSEIISNQADADALTRLGYPITAAEMIRRFIGWPKRDIWAQIARERGAPFPDGVLAAVEADIKSRYRASLEAIPGVAEAVRAVGAPRCVASSSEMVKLRLALEVAGLLDLFDPNIFSASQVPRGKPAPDLFMFAASAMGVAPADCVVVEDSRAGVDAAVAAGMRVIGFTGGSHSFPGHAEALRSAGAGCVIASMQQLAATVREIRRRRGV
jgi:HAD superfamily hydrolase (TIGR01509 family)